MKKRLLTFFIITLIFTRSAFAECDGYYIMRRKNHERPALDSELSYINDYNACCLGPDEKVIYLTFDAGYENGNVERIVDMFLEDFIRYTEGKKPLKLVDLGRGY